MRVNCRYGFPFFWIRNGTPCSIDGGCPGEDCINRLGSGGASHAAQKKVPAWAFVMPCIAAVFSGSCNALIPQTPLTRYGHAAWRVKDGKFRGAPVAIAQTQDGSVFRIPCLPAVCQRTFRGSKCTGRPIKVPVDHESFPNPACCGDRREGEKLPTHGRTWRLSRAAAPDGRPS